MDMRVLLEPRGGGKGLATLGTSMTSSSNMVSTNMSLKVARISEDLVTVFTREPPKLSMDHFVSK